MVCIASSACIAAYDTTELEQSVIDNINEIRISVGGELLTSSNEYYDLCYSNSEINADNPTYLLDSSEKDVCELPDIYSVDNPLISAMACVVKQTGDLETDVNRIISELHEAEDAIDELIYDKASISCVIKNGWISTTIILYTSNYFIPSYTIEEMENEIAKLYVDSHNSYNKYTTVGTLFLDACRSNSKLINSGKEGYSQRYFQSIFDGAYRENHGYGGYYSSTNYFTENDGMHGNLHDDAQTILNSMKVLSIGNSDKICVGCYMDKYSITATIVVYATTSW